MSATSKKQVYNIDNNFERATESIFEAAGLSAVIQGSNETLPRSRVEITFQTGQALNQGRRADGALVYDYFNATLTIRIVTERPHDSPSLIPGVSTLHSEFCATVRELLEETKSLNGDYSTAFNSTNLPYYKVNKLQPQGEVRDLAVSPWLEDYTRLSYFIEFGIRSDAWPV